MSNDNLHIFMMCTAVAIAVITAILITDINTNSFAIKLNTHTKNNTVMIHKDKLYIVKDVTNNTSMEK